MELSMNYRRSQEAHDHYSGAGGKIFTKDFQSCTPQRRPNEKNIFESKKGKTKKQIWQKVLWPDGIKLEQLVQFNAES